MKLWGESYIDFSTQCVIMTLARGGGRGVIANDVLKMTQVLEFQGLCPAAAHLCR